MRALLTLMLFAGTTTVTLAQIGGKRTFGFLELPVGAKAASLGGVNVSSRTHDPTLVFSNPALLNPEMERQASFNYTSYLAGVKQQALVYALPAAKNGQWAFGVNYINYGQVKETDPTGAVLGSYRASDYTLQATRTQTSDNFTFGATAKLAVSSLSDQKATGALLDLGGIFKHPERDFTIGLAFRNIGYQLSTYDAAEREPMPFDAQIGMSYKLEHMPLRFSLTAHHLQQFDIVYLDPNKKTQLDADNQPIKEEKSFGDKVLRHFVVGGEFLLSKNFNLRVGYHHLRRRELRLEERAGGAGFSFGGMIQIKSFEFGFTKAYFHAAGSTTYLTVASNLGGLLKKKEAAPVTE